MIIIECFWTVFGAVATGIGAIATAVMAGLTFQSLKMNRKQFLTQLEENKKQMETMADQNFENGFLNRLSALREARNNVFFKTTSSIDVRQDAFEQACLNFYSERFVGDVYANYKEANDFLINVQTFYEALETVLSFVRRSKKVKEYQQRVLNGLTDKEKEWLLIYCKACALRSDNDGLYIELQELAPLTLDKQKI